MKNKIEDLRDHLFATLEALQDEEKPMEIDRARAIADVAKVIVESAKAEVSFLKVATDVPSLFVRGSGFIPLGKVDEGEAPPTKPAPQLVRGAR